MSQCARVLEVLSDYRQHEISEIHERAGTMRLNSRIADLRARGFDIQYRRETRVIYGRPHTYHYYRLVKASPAAHPAHPPSPGTASDGREAASAGETRAGGATWGTSCVPTHGMVASPVAEALSERGGEGSSSRELGPSPRSESAEQLALEIKPPRERFAA